MEKVQLFTALKFNPEEKTCHKSLIQTVDHYFYLGGRRAEVLQGALKNEEAVLTSGKISKVAQIALIISYFIIFIPFVMLIAKLALRLSYPNIKLVDRKSTEQTKPLASYPIAINQAKKPVVEPMPLLPEPQQNAIPAPVPVMTKSPQPHTPTAVTTPVQASQLNPSFMANMTYPFYLHLQGMMSANREIIEIEPETTIADLFLLAHQSGKFGFPDEMRLKLKDTDLRALPQDTKLCTLDLSYKSKTSEHTLIHVLYRNPDVEWPGRYNELRMNYLTTFNKAWELLYDRSKFPPGVYDKLNKEHEILKAEIDKELESKMDQLPKHDHFKNKYPTKEEYINYVKSPAHALYWKNLTTPQFMHPSDSLAAKIEALVKEVSNFNP